MRRETPVFVFGVEVYLRNCKQRETFMRRHGILIHLNGNGSCMGREEGGQREREDGVSKCRWFVAHDP